jgi:flagellar basal-body rod protein FlgB
MNNKIFGLSETALQLCEDRAVLLTNNLTNASTPHYKAQDFDFHKALQNVNQDYALQKTNANHISATNQVDNQQLQYRMPTQMGLDGNSVDSEIERKNFLENALRYQVNLTFIQNKTDQLLKAIKGE